MLDAGAGMQTILANPLADPFTLGISSASFGAALAIVTQVSLIPGFGPFMVTGNAFAMSPHGDAALRIHPAARGLDRGMVLVGIALMFSFNAPPGPFSAHRPTRRNLPQISVPDDVPVARATWTNKLQFFWH